MEASLLILLILYVKQILWVISSQAYLPSLDNSEQYISREWRKNGISKYCEEYKIDNPMPKIYTFRQTLH